MKLILVAILLVPALLFAGPGLTGYSGAPGSLGTCAGTCHGSGTGGTITITGFPEVYEPDTEYLIRLDAMEGELINQFNGSCRIGETSFNAGTLRGGTRTIPYSVPSETNGIHMIQANFDYAEFNWDSPTAGTGAVTLYIAAHQAGFGGPNTIFELVAAEQEVDDPPIGTQWTRTYGGSSSDLARDVEIVEAGYVFAGYTQSFGAGSLDGWLMKVDLNGDSVWSRTYGGDDIDELFDLEVLPNGQMLAVGQSWSLGGQTSAGWLLKLDANGDTMWTQSFDGNSGDKLTAVQAVGNGILMAGNSRSGSAGREDFWLILATSDGEELWSLKAGGTEDDECEAMSRTPDNAVVMAGWTTSFGAEEGDFYLVKVGMSGDTLWTRTFGGEFGDYCYDMVVTPEGDYLLAGGSNSFRGELNQEVWLIKVSQDGDSLWSRTYGGEGYEECFDIELLENGAMILACTGYEPTENYDGILMKVSAEGDSLWSLRYGNGTSDDGDDFAAVKATADFGYILAGSTSGAGAGSNDAWLVKTAADTFNFAPGPFARAIPEDGSTPEFAPEYSITFAWAPSRDPNVQDEVYYFFEASSQAVILDPNEVVTSDTFVTVQAHIPLDPLDDIDTIRWSVTASDSSLLTAATNGEGWFLLDYPGATGGAAGLPMEYSLSAYPNPFNPITTISFSLPQANRVALDVFDVTGRKAKAVADRHYTAGAHAVEFDGAELPSGVYFMRLRTAGFEKSIKVVLLK